MRIIVVGGSGTIGKVVAKELAQGHEIIVAARQHGDVQVDITDPQSIEKMYKKVGEFDAVVSTTGSVKFIDLTAMKPEDYDLGLRNKLMGQVNLVLMGIPLINDKGSFSVISGILSHDPIRTGSSASMVNGALESFVKAAAIEMPRGIRINCISPTVVTESLADYGDYFPGFEAVPAARVGLAFKKSVEGLQTGQVYSVG